MSDVKVTFEVRDAFGGVRGSATISFDSEEIGAIVGGIGDEVRAPLMWPGAPADTPWYLWASVMEHL